MIITSMCFIAKFIDTNICFTIIIAIVITIMFIILLELVPRRDSDINAEVPPCSPRNRRAGRDYARLYVLYYIIL